MSISKKMILLSVNILILLFTAATYIITYLKPKLTEWLFSYTSYYIILVLIVSWVLALIYSFYTFRPDIRLFLKKYGRGILFSLLVAVIVFVSVPPFFRVLSDETSLAAVSKSMIYERRVDNVAMGVWSCGWFFPIARAMEKRPLVFPFFTHILHTISGYRAENAFVLNFMTLFFYLFIVYFLVKRRFGDIWGYSAVILVAAQPIVSQAATSGGFDLFSALFFLISFLCLRWFLKKPDADKLLLLCINMAVFSNIRYESIAVSGTIVLCLSLLGYMKSGYFKGWRSLVYLFMPLFMLPFFWQRWLIKPDIQFDNISNHGPAFSIGYLLNNNLAFFKTLIDFKFFLPYATLVNLIGIISVIFLSYIFIKRRLYDKRYPRDLMIAAACGLLALWTIYMSFHDGWATRPYVARYFVLYYTLFSLMAVTAASFLKIFYKKPAYLLLFSITVFMIYHPLSVQDRFSKMLTMPREYRFTTDFLNRANKESRNFIVVSLQPDLYTVQNFSAVDFSYANGNDFVATGYNNHLFSDIYVIQQVECKTMKPVPAATLREGYNLQSVAELQEDALFFTRISKITGEVKLKSNP